MQRILTIAAVLLALVLVGCNSTPVQPSLTDTSNQPDSLTGVITEPIQLGDVATDSGSVRPQLAPAALGGTYAYGVIPWHDNIEGDDDWMIVFYLPNNPGTVKFFGQNLGGIWNQYTYPWVKIYDARWTSQGFRVMIFTGKKVVWLCSTSPSHYLLQY